MLKTIGCCTFLSCCFVFSHAAMLKWSQAPKVIEFDEKIFNNYLQVQDYTHLEPITYEFLEVQHKSKVFDLIEKGMIEKKDPFCLYTHIRSKVLIKRNNGTLGSMDIALILRNMVISLMLLAGDLACCIVFGGEESVTHDMGYACFRNHYEHWYEKHLAQDAVEFKLVCEAVVKWIDQMKNIQQPSPYWVRYFYQESLPFRWVIHFNTPKQNELRAFNKESLKDLITKERAESQADFIQTLQSCNDWATFFKLGLLKDLNKKTLNDDVTKPQPESSEIIST